MADIHVVSMPFMPVHWPSIGLSQLVAAGKEAGLNIKASYPSLWFANTIGLPMYSLISTILRPYSHPHSLLAEWIFSGIAFREMDISDDEYIQESFSDNAAFLKAATMLGYGEEDMDFYIHKFQEMRTTAEHFVRDVAQQIVDDNPRIVGCTTSYMQYASSLALLRTIKSLNPSIMTMLGGAECEREKGYVTAKNFEWVDFVVSGEADTLFPALCQQLLANGPDLPVDTIPYGVYCTSKLAQYADTASVDLNKFVETAIVEDVNTVPIPDYRDYFETLHQTGLAQQIEHVLVAETSRGCWKGATHPCNFCGLNGTRIRYRSKSSERVLHELDVLTHTYGIKNVIMTDSILNPQHFTTLFPELARQNKPYHLFFEANSNLRIQQVKQLAEAGVLWIQPGVESLHDEILVLLNKKTSAIHNIALLKYALEYGVKCTWYMLTGIPGEQDRYYQEMADFLPLLYHFEPPFFVRDIRIDRFSEYHQRAEEFGLSLSPFPNYQHVYPFDAEDLSHFATFFQYKTSEQAENREKPGLTALKKKIAVWRIRFSGAMNCQRPKLVMHKEENRLILSDSRSCAVAPTFVLTDMERAIYHCCREPVTQRMLLDSLRTQQVVHHEFDGSLKNLIDKKFLIHLNGKYLALATFEPQREIPTTPTGF